MITLWHNPRCSKSRQALALLEQADVEIRVRFYLKEPPDLPELQQVLDRLGMKPRDLLRRGEQVYKDLDLKSETEDAALLSAMVAHPILIERPIALSGSRAVVGRPPDNVLTLLP